MSCISKITNVSLHNLKHEDNSWLKTESVLLYYIILIPGVLAILF